MFIDSIVLLCKLVCKTLMPRTLRIFILKLYYLTVRGKLIIRKVDGIYYELDLDELIDAAVNINIFEIAVRKELVRHCTSNMSVLDIGANIGAHALPLAHLVRPDGAVYAFEPTKYAFDKLRRNAELNPQLPLKIFRLALSDYSAQDKEVDFRSSWLTYGGRKDAPCHVDFGRLDEWADIHLQGNRISLVKIDVDGNEYQVIKGGYNLLVRDKPIIVIEAVGPHFSNDNQNPFLLLWKLGWRIYTIDEAYRFSSVNELSALLPKDDPKMTKSINVVLVYEQAFI